MSHTIEFVSDLTVDLETSSGTALKPMFMRKRSRWQAQVRPHVVETAEGLIEAADLFFGDGTRTRLVPFACFRFADGNATDR
jgi:hypothetical protein